jgi:hypothetical protein
VDAAVLAGIAWVLLQSFSLTPIFMERLEFGLFDAFVMCSLYLGFSAFTYVTSLVAKQQADSRDELRRLNSELRATRTLLTESSRIAERVRISRDLHDLVGHHLTALSLNLEVASHLVSGTAQDHVRQAQSVAKLLLSDVREVVSQLRENDNIDLTEALKTPGRRRAGTGDPSRHATALLGRRSVARAGAACAARRKSSRIRCAIPARAICGCAASALIRTNWRYTRATTAVAPVRCSKGNGLTGMRERLGAGRRAPRHRDRARRGFRTGCMAAAGGQSMNVARNISVCLVDDQTLVRQGIRSLLELSDEIRVVAEAADGIQALDIVPKVKPDVVLLDMRMPWHVGTGRAQCARPHATRCRRRSS